MKNVLVFFGGESEEREISVVTGVMTCNSLKGTKYKPVPVYIDGDGAWFTGEELFDIESFSRLNKKKLKRLTLCFGERLIYEVRRNKLLPYLSVSAAINCLHGKPGEDGALAGLLELSSIPYASPSLFSSSLSMDKSLCSKLLKNAGYPVVEGDFVSRKEYYDDRESVVKRLLFSLGTSLIVKPAEGGSSVGISVVKEVENELIDAFLDKEEGFELRLSRALKKAFSYGEGVVVEKYIENAADVNCAAVRTDEGVSASRVEAPTKHGDFFSFEDKYLEHGKSGERKEKLAKNIEDRVRELTKKIYEDFRFFGIVRIDYLLKGEELFVNEINSVPGSLAYYLFSDKLADFSLLLEKLLDYTLRGAEAKKRKAFSSRLSFEGLCGGKLGKC